MKEKTAIVTDTNSGLSLEQAELIYIPMSSGLSGSCGTAAGLAREYGGKVHVIDNHRISVTLRQSALEAKYMVRQGKSTEEIVKYLEADGMNASIYVSVNTLKYLKQSGRVTAAGAAVGTVLNIKPVLQIQGGKLDAYRGRSAWSRDHEGHFDRLKNRFTKIVVCGSASTQEKESMKTGIVDVGGGLRGVYAAGIFDYCLDLGIRFDLGIGVSAESANVSSYHEVDGVPYYDGALGDTIPIEKAFAWGCDKVVLILTKPRETLRTPEKDIVFAKRIRKKYPNAAKRLEQRADQYNCGGALAEQYEAQGRVLILAPDDTCGVDTLTKDQEALKRFYEKGYQDARAIEGFLAAEAEDRN